MMYKVLFVNNPFKCALSVLFLLVGIGIYLLFRPQNILVFGLLDDLGLMPIVDTLKEAERVLESSIRYFPSGRPRRR